MGDRRLCFVSTLLRSVLSRHSFGLRALSSPDISSHRENRESLLETSGSYIVPRQDINFAGRKQVQFWIQPRLDFMGTVSAEALVDQVLEKTPRPSTFNGDGNALVKTQGESAKENTALLIEKNMQEDYDAQNVPRPTSFNEEENTLVKKQKENVEENTEFSAEKEIQVDYKSHNVVSTNHQVLDSTAELSMEKKMHENYNIENAVASLSLQTENGHTCEEKKLHVVFVLGGPGSGKGTQCAKIVETFGFTHLSAGDLLRAEIKSGSENGTMIQNMIKEGKIVPSEVTVKLLQKAMQENENDKFLIDGFPRNEENRAAFENVTGIEPEFILFFDCPEEEMERRLLNRNQGRVDDNIETIRKRFKVFVESSLPVVGYYDLKGKVHKIDAARTKEDIFECIKELFSPYIQETRIVKTKDD